MKICFDVNRMGQSDRNAFVSLLDGLKFNFNPKDDNCLTLLIHQFTGPLQKAVDDFPHLLAEKQTFFIDRIRQKFKANNYYKYIWMDICKIDRASNHKGGDPETIGIFIDRLLSVVQKDVEVAQHGLKRGFFTMGKQENVSAITQEDSTVSDTDIPLSYEGDSVQVNSLTHPSAKGHKKGIRGGGSLHK